jgi:hypothetical protein
MRLHKLGPTVCLGALAVVLALPLAAEPPRAIVIDGRFGDWTDVRKYTDAPNNEHDTDHKGRDDRPERVDHPDVDLLEYKFTHDAENLYGYFKARGVIGRTQSAAPGQPAGRFYAILAIDVDDDEKTGYWLHEGGYYPTSRGYDLNAEIEWYGGRVNVGKYLNHCCVNQADLDQAFRDHSAGQYRPGHRGPYKAGFVRLGPGTYKFYPEWVYHEDRTITFVRDKVSPTPGVVTAAVSPDGHELEMTAPMKGFLVDPTGQPIVRLGRTIHVSFTLEGSGELTAAKKWASNTAEPIRGYVLGPARP